MRKGGSRPHSTTYTEEEMKKAVTAVKRGVSFGRAATTYNVLKSTIHRKVHNLQPKRTAGQLGLSTETEKRIVDIVHQVAIWKVPFDGFDVRLLVKHFLDK